MTTFSYDAAYEPAFPVCAVVLIARASGGRAEVSALIDTGALPPLPNFYANDTFARQSVTGPERMVTKCHYD